MAYNQTVAFSIKIDGVEREINSLKDLKQAKKDATDAFLRGDKDAAKAIADLKDKTEDLTDATQTLKGSGVEKLNGSFAQLSDGFKNFDTEKIKTGFKGIGSAMAAIPILLIVEGFKYLIENFDSLSQGNGILAKTLRVVGESLNGVKEALYSVYLELDNFQLAVSKNDIQNGQAAVDRAYYYIINQSKFF